MSGSREQEGTLTRLPYGYPKLMDSSRRWDAEICQSHYAPSGGLPCGR